MNEAERVVEAEIVQVEDLHRGRTGVSAAKRRSAARGFAAARSTETASTKMEVAACFVPCDLLFHLPHRWTRVRDRVDANSFGA